jgi:hypothetical protein
MFDHEVHPDGNPTTSFVRDGRTARRFAEDHRHELTCSVRDFVEHYLRDKAAKVWARVEADNPGLVEARADDFTAAKADVDGQIDAAMLMLFPPVCVH